MFEYADVETTSTHATIKSRLGAFKYCECQARTRCLEIGCWLHPKISFQASIITRPVIFLFCPLIAGHISMWCSKYALLSNISHRWTYFNVMLQIWPSVKYFNVMLQIWHFCQIFLFQVPTARCINTNSAHEKISSLHRCKIGADVSLWNVFRLNYWQGHLPLASLDPL